MKKRRNFSTEERKRLHANPSTIPGKVAGAFREVHNPELRFTASFGLKFHYSPPPTPCDITKC